MKKVLLSIVIAVFFVLSACTQQTDESFNLDFAPDSDTIDYEGAHIRLLTGWDEEWSPEIGFTVMGDNMHARYDEILKKYNCVIDIYEPGGMTFETFVMINLAATTNLVPDIIDCHASEIYGLYKSGMLYPYDDIETIDLSDEKWGNKNFIRYGNFEGLQYGTFPYDWEFIPAILGVCVFDSTVLRETAQTSPHELLEAGTWTWETFEEMLKKGTYAEGEDEYFGLGYGSAMTLAQTALFSNGAEVVTESDDKLTFSLDTPQALKAFDWIASISDQKLIKECSYDLFNNHSLLFYVGESYFFTHMTQFHIDGDYPVYEHDGYGFIPFPAGPDGEYGKGGAYVTKQRRLDWVLEAGEMEKNDLGTVLDLMFEPLTGTGEKAWIDFLRTSVFYYGNTDADIFLNMVENVKYDYSSKLEDAFTYVTDAYASIVKGKTPTEVIGGIKDSVQEALND